LWHHLIVNQTIKIMKKAILKKLSLVLPIFLSMTIMAFSQRTITGTVMDDSGESLIGASVLI